MCRLARDVSDLAAARPLFLPPTNAIAPRAGELTSAGASCPPEPDTNVTGSPALAIMA